MTLLLFLLACPADDGGTDPIVSAASDCGSHGNLEILPLDIWGRDVDAQVSLDREPTLFSDSGAGPGVLTAPLGPTSFEFQVIAGEVDLSNISFIRLIDVPGSGDFFDALGNPIFDSWVSQQSGGLDLDAIGFLSTTVIPEPATAVTAGLALMSIVLLPTRWRRGGGGR